MSARELEEARDREARRDENELVKLLIHKLPINKNDGELLFTLPEAEKLHESICNMLENFSKTSLLHQIGKALEKQLLERKQ